MHLFSREASTCLQTNSHQHQSCKNKSANKIHTLLLRTLRRDIFYVFSLRNFPSYSLYNHYVHSVYIPLTRPLYIPRVFSAYIHLHMYSNTFNPYLPLLYACSLHFLCIHPRIYPPLLAFSFFTKMEKVPPPVTISGLYLGACVCVSSCGPA